MVCGCFSYDGVGLLPKNQWYNEKRTLSSHLIGEGVAFQPDNNLKHTSKLSKTYLQSKVHSGVLKFMDWSLQYSDGNPIELLCEELDREVRLLYNLWDHRRRVWGELQPDKLKNLMKRMARICAPIIKAKEKHFDKKLSQAQLSVSNIFISSWLSWNRFLYSNKKMC